MYEVVNEELGIKSCGLGDLTAQQMQNFLVQWEEGATIGTLTLFYDRESGDVVLNKDNKQYELYLELAVDYLSSSAEVRREIRKSCPIPDVKETLDVLEDCLKLRKIEKEIYRALNNCISSKVSKMVLSEIYKRYNASIAVLVAFRYGVMQGKRMERAKRK